MSLDEPTPPDTDRDRVPAEGRKPSFGKSLAIIVIFVAAAISIAVFVANRSNPERENDPRITAPTGRP